MPHNDDAQVMVRLAQQLRSVKDERPTASAVIARALEIIPGVDWVSLTVRTSRTKFVTLASSDSAAEQADELQYQFREGPCVEAAIGSEYLRSGDLRGDQRWPEWGPRAADLGVRSLLSIMLASDGTPMGALNFYSKHDGAFGERDDVDFALLYGAHVALALTTAQEITGLNTALLTRHSIGLAQGILMERYGLDVDASFSLLTRYSSMLERRLADVASDIVMTGKLPDVEADERV